MPKLKKPSISEDIKTFIDINYTEYKDDILLADGFDNCFIGIMENEKGNPVAVYDKWAMIKQLAKDFKSDDGEALEYYEYNIAGAYLGDFTPKYLDRFER